MEIEIHLTIESILPTFLGLFMIIERKKYRTTSQSFFTLFLGRDLISNVFSGCKKTKMARFLKVCVFTACLLIFGSDSASILQESSQNSTDNAGDYLDNQSCEQVSCVNSCNKLFRVGFKTTCSKSGFFQFSSLIKLSK